MKIYVCLNKELDTNPYARNRDKVELRDETGHDLTLFEEKKIAMAGGESFSPEIQIPDGFLPIALKVARSGKPQTIGEIEVIPFADEKELSNLLKN